MGDGTGAHCPGAGEGTSRKLEWEKGHVIGKENSSIAQGGERKAQASAGGGAGEAERRATVTRGRHEFTCACCKHPSSKLPAQRQTHALRYASGI